MDASQSPAMISVALASAVSPVPTPTPTPASVAFKLAPAETGTIVNNVRVTRGDAQAVFEAFGGGGWVIRLNAGTVEGAPADFLPDGMARISPSSGFNQKHYCALDWHVISVALLEGNRPGEIFSESEIRDRLAGRHVEFTLDGAPLATVRNSPRRIHNPEFRGFYEAVYVQEGRIMAPEDLAVGPHVLTAIGYRVGRPTPEVLPTVTFFVDEVGSGTCGASSFGSS